MRRAAVSLLFVVVGACEPAIPEGRFACDTDADCPDEMVCRPPRGRCFSTRGDEDAGRTRDAGRSTDAGPIDAGGGPGASLDAGAPDASRGDDAGALDASARIDASGADAASTDASAGGP